jgi:threonine dehydratase
MEPVCDACKQRQPAQNAAEALSWQSGMQEVKQVRAERWASQPAGEVTLCDPTIDAREAATAEIQAATGAVFIPPYNAKNTIAGQGTIALELLEQVRG